MFFGNWKNLIGQLLYHISISEDALVALKILHSFTFLGSMVPY